MRRIHGAGAPVGNGVSHRAERRKAELLAQIQHARGHLLAVRITQFLWQGVFDGACEDLAAHPDAAPDLLGQFLARRRRRS